ncbi:MAG: HlyD family efflux transporter periplasmic adaptor subunit [Oscillatoria sp. PMC 1051.18]|uniref:HlyD family efflux transporter periplasmic adaptor subunit n=1 Tax=Oscillatoria salina TaxID=331517 RepID=UPI001CCCDE50|nr:HlyD family efflux transporter periplasmic adaptor subunit [Oscillatoria salina]MBZ8181496.1 HlyD family efflux transporter periplasmic adaptor subunit [Oscillatoria salina IIICB1]MEC4892607.1 HlyD family efflux transporter periplasmic adaptor subunit [Oscillatoria sp. PMC 1050.18]MEC5032019.1 HlyD family efflux transporter periplasmic adaptor subunit [Oscillatoria sp. PMC 1051.18]
MGDRANSKETVFAKPGKRWAIALSIVGAIATTAVAVYSLNFASKPFSSTTQTVSETAEINAVTALGRIEPLGEVTKLSAPISLSGARVEKLNVEEGDLVETNEIIAILDNHSRLQAAVESAEKDISVAEANLSKIKAGAKLGDIQAQQATIERLNAQLSGEITAQEASLARLIAELEGEKLELNAKIAALESELANARIESERYELLAANGVVSQSALDLRRLNLDTARENLNEAKASQSRIVATLSQQIQETQANLTRTRNTLEKQIQEAQANLASISEVRPVDIKQAQAELEKAIATYKQAQADLEQAYVRAPFSGQILEINTRPGESVSEGDGIVELAQTSQMLAIAEVYESDIGKVKIGQSAIIESENGAFSKQIKGTVNQISLQIGKQDVLDTDPAADVDARVVEVKILLNPEDSQLVAHLTNAKVFVKILI